MLYRDELVPPTPLDALGQYAQPPLKTVTVSEWDALQQAVLALSERLEALEGHRHQIPAMAGTMQYTTRPVGFGSKPGGSK